MAIFLPQADALSQGRNLAVTHCPIQNPSQVECVTCAKFVFSLSL